MLYNWIRWLKGGQSALITMSWPHLALLAASGDLERLPRSELVGTELAMSLTLPCPEQRNWRQFLFLLLPNHLLPNSWCLPCQEGVWPEPRDKTDPWGQERLGKSHGMPQAPAPWPVSAGQQSQSPMTKIKTEPWGQPVNSTDCPPGLSSLFLPSSYIHHYSQKVFLF